MHTVGSDAFHGIHYRAQLADAVDQGGDLNQPFGHILAGASVSLIGSGILSAWKAARWVSVAIISCAFFHQSLRSP
jgi:hypothetical protein